MNRLVLRSTRALSNREVLQQMVQSQYRFQEALLLCLPVAEKSYQSFEAEISTTTDQASTPGQSNKEHRHATRTMQKVTCTKGCGSCCHYGLISSSSLEAFVLFARLIGSGMGLPELAAACGNYVHNYKQITQAGGLVGHFPFSTAARRAFVKARLPCPLFVPTPNQPQGIASYAGHCGVHELRPLICSLFNSTESAQKCLNILKHHTQQHQISAGTAAAENLRAFEQAHFGKSALGHLPLLLAAMTTQKGLDAFLRIDARPQDTAENPYAAGTADFFFYLELLEAIGIELGERDYLDLEKAQAEEEQ